MSLLSLANGKAALKLLTTRSNQYSGFKSFSTSFVTSKNIAVVLSGCGVYDGSEVHESAAALAAISRHGFDPICFAPDIDQAHVINHQKGEVAEESRNVLSESARVARTSVKSLKELSANSNMDAVVFPGGFGAAKNLSNFGFKGKDMTVHEEVERVLNEFHSSEKPIALCCIAPILAAKVLGKHNLCLTLGKRGDEKLWPYQGALDAAESFGAQVMEKQIDEVCVDKEHRVITTPAFMYNGKFHEIQDSVNLMVKEMVNMM